MVSAPWLKFGGVVVALILVPFALFVGTFEELWTLIRFGPSRAVLTLGIVSALASDVLLPIPSSLVSVAAGWTLGVVAGTLVSTAGMTLGCLLAYRIGSGVGRPDAKRILGEHELARLEGLMRRYGPWTIALCRAVPVLAEASVLVAGVTRIPLRTFLLMTAVPNLVISAVYAMVGAEVGNRSGYAAVLFVIAFGLLVAIPALTGWRLGLDTRRPQQAGSSLSPHEETD